ncbi:MAG TPA: cupin domain-containing protein [Candidatus Methylomirabilis sp.]|nr:cupin domain-containing protein [Candidatus Methylomirabilis sp.]
MATDQPCPKLVPAGEGRVLHVLGETLVCKVVGGETGGAYALLEIQTPPQVGPPMHVHRREDEGFYVLGGTYELRVGGQVLRTSTGTFVFGPRGIPHSYLSEGPAPGRQLATITPAGFERFFEELSRLPPSPPDLEALKGIARKYDLVFA